jgi:hypothetical protein
MNFKIVCLSLIYLAASFVFIDHPNFDGLMKYRYIIIALGIAYFTRQFYRKFSVGQGKLRVGFNIDNWFILGIWIFFSVLVLFAQSIDGAFPFEGLVYLWIVPMVFFLFIPLVFEEPIKAVLISAFISSFFFLMVSLIYVPVTIGHNYRGITGNSNSIGQLSVQATIASFCFLLNSLEKKNGRNTLIFTSSFLLSFIFVILAHSRTSLVAIMIPCFATLVLFLSIKKIKIKKLIIPTFFFSGIYWWKIHEYVTVGILSKFQRQRGSNNILSNRDDIWRVVIDDLTLFGHGADYFMSSVGHGAHNSILSITGVYGIIPGIFLTALFIASISFSVVYAIKNRREEYFYAPFIVILSFFVLSMAESMFGVIGKGMTIVYFNVLGVLIFRKKPSN